MQKDYWVDDSTAEFPITLSRGDTELRYIEPFSRGSPV